MIKIQLEIKTIWLIRTHNAGLFSNLLWDHYTYNKDINKLF